MKQITIDTYTDVLDRIIENAVSDRVPIYIAGLQFIGRESAGKYAIKAKLSYPDDVNINDYINKYEKRK